MFNCAICFEEVSVSTVLPCGHDFCKGCLANWTKTAASDTLSCPKCRSQVPIRTLQSLQLKFHGALPCAVCEVEKPAFRLQFCRECGTHQCNDCAFDPCHTAKAHAISPFHHLTGVARLKESLKRGLEGEAADVSTKAGRMSCVLRKELQSRLLPAQPIHRLITGLDEAYGQVSGDGEMDGRFDHKNAIAAGRRILQLVRPEEKPAPSDSDDVLESRTAACIDVLLGKVPNMPKALAPRSCIEKPAPPEAVPFSPLHRGLFVARPDEVGPDGVPSRIHKVVGATRLRSFGCVSGRPLCYADGGSESEWKAGIAGLLVCTNISVMRPRSCLDKDTQYIAIATPFAVGKNVARTGWE